MLAAYTDFSSALHTAFGSDTARRNALYAAAQSKYAAVVRRAGPGRPLVVEVAGDS